LSLLDTVELLRIRANSDLDPRRKSRLGQYFTSKPICEFMASLFGAIAGDVRLLDPGAGSGSLTAAFVHEAIRRAKVTSIRAATYDIESAVTPYLMNTTALCEQVCADAGVSFAHEQFSKDFITEVAEEGSGCLFSQGMERYSHVIMNPPYKKISNASGHRKALRAMGVETVNLYTGFVAIALKLLEEGGELVAITPRSFCNGPYYQPFRELLLREMDIQHIHIFESRNKAFSDDDVLQENIIVHCVRASSQGDVVITSSPSADFYFDEDSKAIAATDMTIRTVPFESIVDPADPHKFIRIAANDRDQAIIDRLSVFTSTLEDVGIEVSTGPVVDFRHAKDLRKDLEPNAVPLLYPIHLNRGVSWPKQSKKPNAIAVTSSSRSWLWRHNGNFIITRRFSAKEEKRRIVATLYDSSLPGDLIGFDNKLNVFHANREGLDEDLAKGLYVYLNSSLLDKYYRLFGGHTQVNATDLRAIPYPSVHSLQRIGAQVANTNLAQKEIDTLLAKEIARMTGDDSNDPLDAQGKIYEALDVIVSLGMPRAQQNERSALTLLALLNLHPDGTWQDLARPLIGVTPIMDWCREVYGKGYAPNTRETFRRQTLHQFVDAGLCLYNPDRPDRPVNSPKACYQITAELHGVLLNYGTERWESALSEYLKSRGTLARQYAKEREMHMIPLVLPDGTEIKLSAGAHSQLIKDIILQFGPRFAPGSEIIYLGDTGAKEDFFNYGRLEELGVVVDRKGKLPDVILYWPEKDCLLLIEAVTSHGSVDPKRHGELGQLFTHSKPGIIYVTAFPDRRTMAKYLSDISWETEVWTADAPTHMIHFDGDRFLGPHD